MTRFDLGIVGAGPAGLSAAITAAEAGLSVALLDEQPGPGGQIYRAAGTIPAARRAILGDSYARGETLIEAAAQADITRFPNAQLWAIETGFRVSYTQDGAAAILQCEQLLLATGAMERPMPLPGWTLPGVMGVGAAQILLKQSGLVAEGAVLVGCGPLIYLTAAQMLRAGAAPRALVETQSRGDMARALRHLPGALRGWRSLREGLGLMREIARAGVPRYRAARDISIDGQDRAERVRFRAAGRSHELSCDIVLLHHGVVPHIQAARSAGVAHRWDARQHAFVPVRDRWGQSDVEGLWIAGDGAGIAGAIAAECQGRIAALGIAARLGRISPDLRDRQAQAARRALSRETALRPFLDTAYPPLPEALSPHDDTVICRCEEVTAGAVRRAAGLGCLGPNQAKAFERVGMGPCQGRICGLSVTNLLAEAHGQSAEATGYFRIRPPIKPVTLGELAALDIAAQTRTDT